MISECGFGNKLKAYVIPFWSFPFNFISEFRYEPKFM